MIKNATAFPIGLMIILINFIKEIMIYIKLYFQKIKYHLIDFIVSGVTFLQKFYGFSYFYPFWGVYFVITLRCNLNCPHCFVFKQTTAKFNTDISATELSSFLSKLVFFKFIKPRIHLFGGEPTVNKEFIKILQQLSLSNFKVTLRTNGIIKKEYFKKIISCPSLDKIIFSIHLKNLHLHIKQLCSLIAKENLSRKKRKRIKIYICGTIEEIQKNYSSIDEFIKIYENIGCRHIKIQHMKNTGITVSDHNKNNKIIEEIALVKKTKCKIPILFSPNIKLKDLPAFYRDDFAVTKNNCLFPWFSTIITPQGSVFVCEGFQKTEENIKDKSLQNIWNGENYRKIRKNIARNGCQLASNNRCADRRYYGLLSKYFDF